RQSLGCSLRPGLGSQFVNRLLPQLIQLIYPECPMVHDMAALQRSRQSQKTGAQLLSNVLNESLQFLSVPQCCLRHGFGDPHVGLEIGNKIIELGKSMAKSLQRFG